MLTNVGADQAIIAQGSVDATAVGYKAAVGSTPTTYAGSLDITAEGDGSTITARAETLKLTVSAENTVDVGVLLQGDVKTATVNLVNGMASTMSMLLQLPLTRSLA